MKTETALIVGAVLGFGIILVVLLFHGYQPGQNLQPIVVTATAVGSVPSTDVAITPIAASVQTSALTSASWTAWQDVRSEVVGLGASASHTAPDMYSGGVTLHHTGSENCTGNHPWNVVMDPGDSVPPYSFLIDQLGVVYQLTDFGAVSWHAQPEFSHYDNQHRLGIALVGNFESTSCNETPTEAQLSALVAFLVWAKTNGLANATLYGHNQLKPKACPGDNVIALMPQIAAATGFAYDPNYRQ